MAAAEATSSAQQGSKGSLLCAPRSGLQQTGALRPPREGDSCLMQAGAAARLCRCCPHLLCAQPSGIPPSSFQEPRIE